MDNPKQAVVDRLKQANNVLVTVKASPSVDELAACIGLSLALNKLDKHATAVFSGEVPSAIEFLQPEQTIEKDTDSLRDFIISLDKSKADKLRYKVEDQVVRIFITPYKTSITEQDLDFSQGDFNVDVVLALGVQDQNDVDTAITTHGRILHDATIVTINNTESGEIGTLNWFDAGASSLSEMATGLATALKTDVLDEQIATAFLTGIVAETDRFSNEKTSSDTMKVSAALMAAGANQQLVATKLEEEPINQVATNEVNEANDGSKIHDDGTLEITHDTSEERTQAPESEMPEEPAQGNVESSDADASTNDNPDASNGYQNPRTILSEPAIAPLAPAGDDGDKPLESISLPPVEDRPPLLNHDAPMANAAEAAAKESEPPAASAPDEAPMYESFDDMKQALEPHRKPDAQPEPDTDTSGNTETLADIERQVNSPHLAQSPQLSAAPPKPVENHMEELDLSQLQRPAGLEDESSVEAEIPQTDGGTHVDAAREAVDQAIQASDSPVNNPIAALNAQPLGDPLHPAAPEVPPAPAMPIPEPPAAPIFPDMQPPAGPAGDQSSQPTFPPLPSSAPQPQPPVTAPSSAPPVPPPVMPMPPTFGQQ